MTPRPDGGGGRGLALALFAVAFGTNVPTALLLRYRELLGFSPTVLTVSFAVYAVGLVPALLVAGPASDRRGRRPWVWPFVLLSAVASVLLVVLAWRSLPALLVGRFLQGVVSGAVFSVASAWLGELEPDPATAARRATVAMSLGFSLGPLSAGLLGQFAPWPTTLPYLLHLALVVPGLLLVLRAPETVQRRTGRGRLVHLGVPVAARPAFVAFVLPAASLVFAFPAIGATILPLGAAPAVPGLELAVTGVVAGLTLGVGVVVQPLATRLGPPAAAVVGASSGALGLLLGAVALAVTAPWLLLPAAVLLGAGYGATLAAGLTATQALADPAHRGALVSTFYALTYVGFGAPVVLTSVATGPALTGPTVAAAAVAGAIAVWLAVGPGRRLVTDHHAGQPLGQAPVP